ncbi:MAG: DNA mismatch repair protein MutS [Byssovorax sp.]
MEPQASAKKKLTPVMRQHEEAKASHPDALLFFRLGDFYEMFGDDAVVCSKALGITLTSRNKANPDEDPMCGVPYHAAHGYIAKLLALGHKVALCEQMGDPSKIKGIVPRQVVRVVTPGLITDVDQLDARENHYLVAVDVGEGDDAARAFGLALLDLSTGELLVARIQGAAALLGEIARADPREIIFAAGLDDVKSAVALSLPRAALRDDERLPVDLDRAALAEIIDATVDVPLADAALAAHPLLAVRAAARALRFARNCTPGQKIPVRRLVAHDPSSALRIDETAEIHLELVRAVDGARAGSLLDVIDGTVTPTGARLLKRRLLAPLLDVAAIRRRHDEVELFVANARARTELRAALGGIGDLERLSTRATLREISPRELGGLRDGLLAAPRAVAAVAAIADPGAAELLGTTVDTVDDVAARLLAALVDRPPPHARDGGMIRPGYDSALDASQTLQKNGAEMIVALEAELRASTGATSLRVRYTRVFGYYIEVTRTHLAKVPPAWRRKQTVAGAERFTSDVLDDLADKIEHAESRALEREAELFEALVVHAAAAAERIRKLARVLAGWDVAAGLADVAHRHDYARPHVDAGDTIAITDGRHPVVERYAAAGRFVPNDTTLDLAAERLWLVTGPNMAGKSTLMRQVALIVILAQMGSYVPAREARIGVVDRVLSRVGASDNLARGESTFMVEMRETSAILRDATRRSLVILDEIGRGTSTYDGLAIAWAVAEHLHDAIGCRALFATHYHELTELSKQSPGVANYSVAAREHGDDVVFLHKLARGPASRSYGIAVARLAGIGEGVLARAKAILASLEAGAALPTGKPASLRGRSKAGAPQLDLFAPPAKAEPSSPVLETLRAVDVNRLSPMEALQLIAKLKGLLGTPG